MVRVLLRSDVVSATLTVAADTSRTATQPIGLFPGPKTTGRWVRPALCVSSSIQRSAKASDRMIVQSTVELDEFLLGGILGAEQLHVAVLRCPSDGHQNQPGAGPLGRFGQDSGGFAVDPHG